MAKKGTILVIAWLLLITASWADDITDNRTLDSLVRVALERNPAIHALGYRHRAAEYQANYAGWLPDPQLTVGVLNLPRTSFSFNETPMTGVSVGMSQTIPWPGKLSVQAEIAGLNSESRVLHLAAGENSVIRLVTSNYYDYSFWTLTGDILAENLKLIQDIIDVAQTRYANGLGSAQDVLRSQTAEARLENRILMTRQRRSSALTRLGWLTDNPATIHASLTPVLPPISSDATDSISEVSNPILANATLKSTIAGKQVSLARSSYWPDLMFGVDYRIRKDIPMDPVRGEDFLTFKVGLKMPLWFFARQKNQTAAARQSFLASQAEEHSITNEIEQRVADILLALQSLTERIEQYHHSILPQGEAAREAAQVAYEVGQVDFNGLLSAQLEVMDIELERLELLKQYHQQAAVLRELTTDVQRKVKP